MLTANCLSRRELLVMGTAGLLAGSASAEPDVELSQMHREQGRAFLLAHPSVDLHAHPGRFFLDDDPNPTSWMAAAGKPFTQRTIEDMRVGHVTAVLCACVSDVRLLSSSRGGALLNAREFEPGEAWRDYQRQIGVLQRLVAGRSLVPGESWSDIQQAYRTGRTACVFSVEGADFIEDRLDRLTQAHADGVRAITLVHYHDNQVGDIQTLPLTPGGLTSTGRAIVQEMNRVGLIVDVAHGSPEVVRGVIDIATRPIMASHTNLNRPDFEHARLLSAETARLIARGGGLIGSNPSGLGQKTFGDWIEAILRLVDVVGVNHVGIGTDMDANYAPVLKSYRDWDLMPSTLLSRGMHEAEVAAIMGGNFMRLYGAVEV